MTNQNSKHMNILNKQYDEVVTVWGNADNVVSKRKRYSWAENSGPGEFMMINKVDLNIDGSYQRDEVSKSKVLDIARDWDWKLFGTLSVVERPDGTFWVYDGGHRCRASLKRDDISDLPCMVFEAEDEKTEARAFIGTNTMKNNVSAYHKHRASVVTGEPIAIAAQSILNKHGYFPMQSATKKYGFSAINTLQSQLKNDPALAERVFSVCASIAQDGEHISGVVLKALFTCQKKLEGKADILTNGHLERLKSATLPGIEAAIRREKHIVGRGGELISAKAVLDLLNKNKRYRLSFA